MASIEELIIKLSADNSDLKRKLADSEKGVQQFGGSVSKLGPMIAGAFAIGSITAFAAAGFKAAEEQERANKRLNFALKGNQVAFKELTTQAQRLQSTTGVDEIAIQQIQMLAVSSGKSTEEVKKLVTASIALATATETDLQSAYMQIMGTMNGVAGKLIPKLGDEFAKLSDEQLRNGDVIDLLNAKHGNLAADSVSNLTLLKTNWGELQESAGGALGTVINPLLGEMNNWMTQINNQQGFWDKMGVLLDPAGTQNRSAAMAYASQVLAERQGIAMGKNADMIAKTNAMQAQRIQMEKDLNEAIAESTRRLYYNNKEKEKALSYDQLMTIETRKREQIDAYNVPQSTFASAMGATGPGAMAGKGITPDKGGLFARSVTGGTAAQGAAITEMNLQLEQQIGIINGISQAWSDMAATGEVSMKGMMMVVLDSIRKIITAKLAEAIAGQIASGSSKGLPGLLLAGIGISAVYGMFSKLPKFQTGGIVGGSSFAGDGITARVNSGEMILNTSQQAQLFAMANGGGGRSMEVYGRIKAGDIYLSNKRGAYLSKRRGS